MKNSIALFILFLSIVACNTTPSIVRSLPNQKEAVNKLVNQWHNDAANANFEAYFNKMTPNAVFVGTDASEVWSKKEFMRFSKPYFDQKKAWNFTPIHRNVYTDTTATIAWFDELLDTWMGVCRGSGVLMYQNNEWKIQHYVLSVTVPNKDITSVIALKKERDSLFLKNYKK